MFFRWKAITLLVVLTLTVSCASKGKPPDTIVLQVGTQVLTWC